MKKEFEIFCRKYSRRFRLKKNEPMASHTSFKVGGPADIFSKPETMEILMELLGQAKSREIPVTFLGEGTNLLVRDRGIRGLVVSFAGLRGITSQSINSSEHLVTAFAGTRLAVLCRFAVAHGLEGLSCVTGIPGSVGGAVVMNAGTDIGTLAPAVSSLGIIGRSGVEEEIPREALNFARRSLTIDLPGYGPEYFPAIVRATFRLRNGNREELEAVSRKLLQRRMATQPVQLASAGCFFKNPSEGEPAGMLIDRAGLKGMRVGDAMVSDVHANYIVNLGNALAEDIILLADKVRKKVSDQFNIQLEPEVRIEGE